MTIDLEFLTTASQDKNKFSIAGIPEKVWQVFLDKARQEMPEKGDKAWASVLTEIIQKHISSSHISYIMTDIPAEAMEKFRLTCAQADIHPDHLIKTLFGDAMENNLYIVNLIALTGEMPPLEAYDQETGELTEEGIEWLVFQKEKMNDLGNSKTLVVTGLANSAWKKWADAGKSVGYAPEELIARTFEAAAMGTLTLQSGEKTYDARKNRKTSSANGQAIDQE